MKIINAIIAKRKAAEEAEELKAREAYYAEHIKEVFRDNLKMMQSIVHNCPKGQAILIKFACGNWWAEELRKEIPSLIEAVKNLDNRWGYIQGSGLGCVNPDNPCYNRDAESILRALTTEPNSWLEGVKIAEWSYVPL